jgi:hypothetical protein
MKEDEWKGDWLVEAIQEKVNQEQVDMMSEMLYSFASFFKG